MKTLVGVGFGVLMIALVAGCAATPYVFSAGYTSENLPSAGTIDGPHILTGSAFLRQKGGGIVTCAGERVVVTRNLDVNRNAYATEYLSLPKRVREVTNVDPRLLEFERELDSIRQANTMETTCDVDGKFSVENIAAGKYAVKSKVFWVVANEGQGGIVGETIEIPESSTPRKESIVVDEVVGYCSVYGCIW